MGGTGSGRAIIDWCATATVARRWRHVPTMSVEGRRALILGLAVAGIVVTLGLLVTLASQPAGQYGIDFGDYAKAAERIRSGVSPYAPEMLAGPVDAQGVDRYRYPPTFAVLLTPLVAVDRHLLLVGWTVLQAACLIGATFIAIRRDATRPRWVSLAIAVAMVGWFPPAFDTLWKGNVGGPMALITALTLVGTAGVVGGSVAAAVALKLSPVALVPAAIRRGRHAWSGMLAVGASAVALGFLAPSGWRDYATVLTNLLAGSSAYSANLAPASIAEVWLGAPPAVVTAVRLATLVGAAILVGWSAILAGRRDRWAAAVAAGIAASLLLPAATWYHYLVVLLPLVAHAATRARRPEGMAIVVGWILVFVGPMAIPVATVGGAVVLGGVLRAELRPDTREGASAGPDPGAVAGGRATPPSIA
jgi:hypothetical protein